MPKQPKILSLQQREEIRKQKRSNPTMTLNDLVTWSADSFGKHVSMSTIMRILKNEKQFEDFNIDKEVLSERYAHQAPKNPELDRLLYEWILLAEYYNMKISGRTIRRKALKIANELNMSQCEIPKFSQGWFYKFKQRHGIKSRRLHGEGNSIVANIVDAGRSNLQNLTSLYEREDIYNVDESCLFYQQLTDYSYTKSNKNGSKKSKAKISIAVSTNATGSSKLPTIFIGKSKWPRCFGPKHNACIDFYYRNSKKSWMTKTIFKEWICGLNDEMEKAGREILLIMDNASPHKVDDIDLSNVRIAFLPPNTTSALQPLDAGILAAAKSAYRNELSDQSIDQFDELVAKKDEEKLKELRSKNQQYEVTQLEAINMWTKAWDGVSSNTITNCWRHTGILAEETLMSRLSKLRVSSPLHIQSILN